MEARENILHELDFEDILTNLSNASEFMYVALCALSNGNSIVKHKMIGKIMRH